MTIARHNNNMKEKWKDISPQEKSDKVTYLDAVKVELEAAQKDLKTLTPVQKTPNASNTARLNLLNEGKTPRNFDKFALLPPKTINNGRESTIATN